MKTEVIISIAVCIPMFLLLLAMSIVLLRGKGAWMITGYNTMPKEKRDQYDTVALCKFTGKALLFFNVLINGFTIGAILFNKIMMSIFGALLIITIVFLLIYANTKNRFKKKEENNPFSA